MNIRKIGQFILATMIGYFILFVAEKIIRSVFGVILYANLIQLVRFAISTWLFYLVGANALKLRSSVKRLHENRKIRRLDARLEREYNPYK